MEIIETDINKIKPDPNQPRTYIDEDDLNEMAQSIITEGVINPIEIDKQFMIITGERRWRAAKIAGLKTISTRVLDLNKNERFMRQVIENIHHNTMSDWDTANALRKIISTGFVDAGNKPQGGKPEEGIRWAAKKIGRSPSYILRKLDILMSSAAMQKAIKEGKTSSTFLRALKRTPEQHKEIIEKKILNNEFVATDGAIDLAFALKREEKNPKVIKKLLETDYSKYQTDYQLKEAIAKMSPPPQKIHEAIAKSYEPSEELSNIVDNLQEWVRNNPKMNIGTMHAPVIIISMNFVKTLIEAWFQNKDEFLEPITTEELKSGLE